MFAIGTTKFIYWQDDNMWVGYLQDYPDYMTQGETLAKLKENSKDIYKDLTSSVNPMFAKQLSLKLLEKTAQPIPKHNEINENLCSIPITSFT